MRISQHAMVSGVGTVMLGLYISFNSASLAERVVEKNPQFYVPAVAHAFRAQVGPVVAGVGGLIFLGGGLGEYRTRRKNRFDAGQPPKPDDPS